ncbi:AMP-binding protein [Dissulfurimicrobium hydrothermale]|uniref:AMP-binding protein n=3 Tax=Dissulfurimicrobium hydrothermale TaxID=1750598 RepID=UPI001EDB6DFA|nr:AMP-binding protein [Dissulfurimicrobium hydrothermale]UKL13619.1 AMP-binding protein [Dissulfurimicrobium hydrothermale]
MQVHPMKIADIDKTAIIYQGREISFPWLHAWIKAFSDLIPVGHGDRVAIFSENRPEWICAVYAAWQRGAAVVPIDALSSPTDIVHVFNDSMPKAIFTSKVLEKVLLDAVSSGARPGHIFVFEDLSSLVVHGGRFSSALSDDDAALIPYTSGTTGRPKGVVLTQRNLLSNIEGIISTGIASRDDRLLSILPFHHTYPIMTTVLTPLFLGATIVMVDKPSSDEIITACRTYKVTIFVGVPRVFELFYRSIMGRVRKNPILFMFFMLSRSLDRLAISRFIFRRLRVRLGGALRYLVSGGARLSPQIARDFAALGLPVVEGYGLTETSPIISFNLPRVIKIGSVGRPLPGVEVKIEGGEIAVRGPNVMKGYLNLPDRTRDAIRDGWFYTGDLGALDQDGYLYITGRKKDMIVLSNGKNINPEEIEGMVLATAACVKEAAVMEKNGRLFCLVRPDLEALKAANISNINEFIKWKVIDEYNRSVPDYKKISGFDVVSSEFPKTRLGKIKRHLLGSVVTAAKRSERRSKGPSDEVFTALSAYLKEVSGKEVFLEDHLEMDLGLDSLGKIELLSFIEKTFGMSVTEDELSHLLLVKDLYVYIKQDAVRVERGEVGWRDVLGADGVVDIDIYEGDLSILTLKAVLSLTARPYFRFKVSGADVLPARPFILAPNHQSLLDGFLIIAALPSYALRDSYFIATEEYFRSPLRRAIAPRMHVIPFDLNRNLASALKKAAVLLRRGKSIVIFPEGARTRDGGLLPFKKAFAILSKEIGVPVVPVAIDGAFRAFPLGSLIPRPYEIHLKFLPPVFPNGMDYDEIVGIVKRSIEGAMKKGVVL